MADAADTQQVTPAIKDWTHDEYLHTSQVMRKHGSGFEKGIGEAIYHGDLLNRRKLAGAFETLLMSWHDYYLRRKNDGA